MRRVLVRSQAGVLVGTRHFLPGFARSNCQEAGVRLRVAAITPAMERAAGPCPPFATLKLAALDNEPINNVQVGLGFAGVGGATEG
jgi:hypothetical protein